MKIILATSTYSLNGGGISSYAHDFISAYFNEHKIIVLTGDKAEKTSELYELYNVCWNDYSTTNALKITNLINVLEPDIIINSNAPLLSIILPFINNQITIISISHFVNGILADVAGFNSKYIDTIITLSNYGKQYIKKRFSIKDDDKISCIFNYITSNLLTNTIQNKRLKNKLTIVYPGGASIHKSPDSVSLIVTQLLKTNFDFTFYWLGDTTIPIAKYFKLKRIEDFMPKDKRLIFTGKLKREEAVNIIQTANIFLLPSRGEGCPISLLEAMSVGVIPIVSNNNHANKEIIINKTNGYIISLDNYNEFTKCIINIINNHEKHQYIYDQSYITFNDKLNISIWKQSMNNVFSKKNHYNRYDKFNANKYFLYRLDFYIILYFNRIISITRSIRYRLVFNFLAFKTQFK